LIKQQPARIEHQVEKLVLLQEVVERRRGAA
jgi:hypothetical protein